MGGDNKNLLIALVPMIISNGLYGYVVGITGNIVIGGQLLCKDAYAGPVGTWTSFGYGQCWRLGAVESGILSSLTPIGAMLSALICFRFSDYLGRKKEVLISAPIYLLGAGLAGFSPQLWGIFLGMLLYGIAIGFTCHGAPLYIAETSPADIRGTLLLLCGAMFSLSMCLGYAFGAALSGTQNTWRWMEIASMPISLLIGIWVTNIPESPRFLILKAVRCREPLWKQKYMTEAHDALQFLRGTKREEPVGGPGRRLWPREVEVEVEGIRSEVAKSVGTQPADWTDSFQYPAALLAGGGIMFAQQVTGQVAVLYTATDILESAGFGAFAALASLGLGIAKLFTTFLAVPCVDKYGRRFLLFAGCTLMAASLLVMSVSFRYRICTTGGSLEQCAEENILLPKAWGMVSIFGLMFYICGYQMGFGAVCWLIIAEVFPLRVRGAAMSLAAAVNFACSAMVVAVQPVLMEIFSLSGVFLLYMVLCLCSIAFTHKYIPETKGKTLEEIEAMMVKHEARPRGKSGGGGGWQKEGKEGKL